MRKEYEMTEEDLAAILKACEPVPYIVVGGHPPLSQQERANNAWEALGRKMGFKFMTVRPSPKGQRFFTAEPVEEEKTDATVQTV